MATNIAGSRLVFVLGKEEHGNRTVAVVESGAEYSIEGDATVYSSELARFPYSL
jgi:hypothetical protein